VRLQRIKERWEREVLSGLQRQERRLERIRGGLARTPPPSRRDRDDRSPFQVLPRRTAPRCDGQLELFVRARKVLRLARANGWARQWLRFGRRGGGWERDPERAARQAVFRLASRAMPKPVREALWLLRGLRGIGLRER
jgi:hypothetical protein